MGLIPGLGRSLRVGNGNPLQDPCLENPMDREAWQTTVHEDAKSRTLTEQLSTDTQFSVSGKGIEGSDDCHQG